MPYSLCFHFFTWKYSLSKELLNSFIHPSHTLKDFILTLNYRLLIHTHKQRKHREHILRQR